MAKKTFEKLDYTFDSRRIMDSAGSAFKLEKETEKAYENPKQTV
jgi:hypothetical protein